MRDADRLVRATAVYAFCHLVVDLACIATVLGVVVPAVGATGTWSGATAVLLYDMVAFCLQLPLGALLDVVGRRRMRGAALLSLVLVAAGVLARKAAAWGAVRASELAVALAAVLLVALGNALFHCAGGVEVLGESEGKAGPSGAFISTGAVGVFVGGLAAFNGWPFAPWLLVGLLVAGAAGVIWLGRADDEGGGLDLALGGWGWAAAMLLAGTVALRSYTGMVMAFPGKEGLALGACAVAAVVAGKAVGGYVADALGSGWASLVSLGGAAAAFWFSWDSMAAGLAGTFLFNFTMAITLSALARLLPHAHGLAFGIASFSLAVGALPALLGLRLAGVQALVALSAGSLVLLELGLLCLRRELLS